MSLTNELNCRVELFARQAEKTALGDTTFAYRSQGLLWAAIRPIGAAGTMTGGQETALPGDTTQVSVHHSITLRANALPHPAEDMYLIYKGVRYNVDFWRPHYRHPDRVELICTMEVPGCRMG